MSIDIKTFLAKNNKADQVVAPHLRTINLNEPQFKKVMPVTRKVRELVHECNQPHRHWKAQNTARQAVELLKTCRLTTPGFAGHYVRISDKITTLTSEAYQQVGDCDARLHNAAADQDLTLEDVASACAVVRVLMMGKKSYYPVTGHRTETVAEIIDDAARFMVAMSDSLYHFEKEGRITKEERQTITALNRIWILILNKTFDELPFSPETHFIRIASHWLDKLPMPANIDDRRKLVQLRLGFPKDAYATQKASDSMLA